MNKIIKKFVSSVVVLLLLTGCVTIRAEDDPVNSDPETANVEETVEGEPAEDETEKETEIPQTNESAEQAADSEQENTESEAQNDGVESEQVTQEKEEHEAVLTDEEPEAENGVETGEEISVEYPAFEQDAQIDDVIIKVSAEEGVFPEGAVLSVLKVEYCDESLTQQSSNENIPNSNEAQISEIDNGTVEAIEQAILEVREEDRNVALSYTFDIKVFDIEGNEIEPNGTVSVKFSLVQKMQDALTVDVYHIDDELNVEALETTVSENETEEDLSTDVEIETESFSYYTVEFTYNSLQYVLDGDSEVELSAILETLGINGEVSGAEVSDSELFDVYEEDGVWYAAALQAFDSKEWMKVTVDGIEYEIVVTDAVNSTFYIEAVEATTITLSEAGYPTVGTAKYGINNTSPSTDYTYGDSISLSAGQKCYWTITSTTTAFSASNYLKFTSTGKINAGGNLSSLIGGETSLPRNYCFSGLFRDCSKLIDASAINFGSITSFNSKINAYAYMFYGCTSLTTAPELPATTLANYCYRNMFYGCTSLTTAPELPATTLASSCYDGMFRGCTSLTTAPELPATTLASGCYGGMFYDCTGLTTAPELPATTLAQNCYSFMFSGCTGLTSAPELPATTLAQNCYNYMFQNCTGLTSAPELPATTLASGCYTDMFYGCTGIKLSETQTGIYQKPYRIPKEGTGTTVSSALRSMFSNTGGTFTGTPSINKTYYVPYTYTHTYTISFVTNGGSAVNSIFDAYEIPSSLPISTKAGYELEGWYTDSGLTNRAVAGTVLTGDTVLYAKWFNPSNNLKDYSIVFSSTNSFSVKLDKCKYDGIVYYSTNGSDWNVYNGETINSSSKIYFAGKGNTRFATSIEPADSSQFILTGSNISCSGNIETLLDYETVMHGEHPSMVDYCFSRIFQGCTGLITAPELPATTLAKSCYSHMFRGCTSLTTAPELPATTLAQYCYQNMFRDCTGLTAAPELPVTTLASGCYQNMFQNCTSLTTAPALPATTLATYCYSYMFDGCTGLTAAPELPATTLANYCYQYMFQNCTSLTTAPALPATTLANSCYRYMFNGCTGIKLSATQTGIYQKPYRIPKEGTGTTATNALNSMFTNTGGTFTGTPKINTKYYVPAVLEYEITIPASISLNSGSSIPLTYEISGGSIGVSIASANSWKLKNGSSQISYSLNKTAWTMAEGTGTENLTLTSSGVPTATGAHTDILTFTYGGV